MIPVQEWRPEHRLLLLLARVSLAQPGVQEAHELLARDLDWAYLAGMAISHGVPQLAYRSLCRLEAKSMVPADVMRWLEASYRANALRHGRLSAALREVICSLRERGVEIIVLKGMALASLVYPEPALRQCGDVDILVREATLPLAGQLLAQLGYAPCVTPSDGPPHHQGYLKGRTLLELHWDVLPRPHPFKMNIGNLWARAQPVSVAGVQTWSLGPEDLLIHLCLHATFHRKFVQEHVALRSFCDITEAVRVLGPDWGCLIRTATAWGVGKHSYVALHVSQKLLGAAVSDDVMRQLQPRQLDPSMLENLPERVLLRHEVPAHVPPRFVRLLAATTSTQRVQALRELLIPPDYTSAEGSNARRRRWGRILSRPGQLVFHWRGFLWDFLRHYRSMMPVWVQRQAIDEWLEQVE